MTIHSIKGIIYDRENSGRDKNICRIIGFYKRKARFISMDKEQVFQKLCDGGLVAVVRAKDAEQAIKITEACIAGGVAGIEITFTVPGADDVIRQLAKRYTKGEILLGAGTVLDAETARIAILAGAQFIISPALNEDVIRLCNRYRVLCVPGVMTIKEAIQAMEAGADLLKVFPADLYGTKIIKDILGPLPYAKLMPTGGVSVDNAKEWVKAGVVAMAAGSSLTAGAKTGDYDKITETAKAFMKEINEARAELAKK